LLNFRNINLLLAFTRFPVSSFLAIIGSLILMYAIDSGDTPSTLINLILVCGVGVLSNIALTIAAESHQWNPTITWGARLTLGVCLFFFYFIFLPTSYDVYNAHTFRLPFQMASVILFLHLLVSYIPFLFRGSEEDFWEYNKDVFLRFVESIFYAFFLFVGLSIALLALDKLFGIDLDGVSYPRLFIFLVGIFHTLYFLSKYPTIFYDNEIKKPIKAYLIFSQYILIPLVLVYLAILYAYAAQIAVKWELPQGWVSQLSLWFSVVGIFAFLLNYFNHKFSDFKLTSYFKKYFFPALLLPTVLVFIAIYRRVSEYGVTELRYVVALLGVWLLGITIYFNLAKKKKIKVIPISLSLIVLLPILTGPLSMFNVAVSSQQKRFKQDLVDRSLLVDKQLIPLKRKSLDINSDSSIAVAKPDSIYYEDKFVLSSAIRYLDKRTDFIFVNDWVEEKLNFISDAEKMGTDSINQYHNGRIIAKMIGIDDLFPNYQKPITGEQFYFNKHQNKSVELTKNKFFLPIQIYRDATTDRDMYFRLNKEKTGLLLYRNGKELGEISLLDYYQNLLKTIDDKENKIYDNLNNNPLLLVQDSLYDASLIINSINGTRLENGEISIENIYGHAIIEFKN